MPVMPERRIESPKELEGVVREILSILPQKKQAHVLALKGDLGAGKTTFTQHLATTLGVTEHVLSPTFVIMRRYDTSNEQFPKLVHIDAYRVEDERELDVLRLEEIYKEPGTIVCIEWPERVPAHIPDDALTIDFSIESGDTRIITYGN